LAETVTESRVFETTDKISTSITLKGDVKIGIDEIFSVGYGAEVSLGQE